MNKNMNSPSKLTEFAPLSPEENQPVVASLFSKLFNFTKGSLSNDGSATSPNNDEQSSSGESESWKQSDSVEKTPDEDTSSVMNLPLDTIEGRSLPNVLKRISNIVALKSSNLQSYKDTQLRSYWMPDSVSKQCYECGERFTTFRRRHHCRVCGQIFCSRCCSEVIPGKIMGCTGDLRVCTYCCKVVLSYLQSSDMGADLTADLKALQEDLQVKYGNDIPQAAQRNVNDDTDPEIQVRRKTSVGYMEEKYALGCASTGYLSSEERTMALQNSASLRMIYEEIFRSSQAIILQTHRLRLRSYPNCCLGSELVDWMIAQNKAATRVQATAIGQAMLEAGFIECMLTENVFTDGPTIFKPLKPARVQTNSDFSADKRTTCDAQEPAWVKTIPQHDSTTDSESETKQPNSMFSTIGRMPSSSSSFYLDLNLEASTVTLKRPTSEELSVLSVDSIDNLVEKKEVNFTAHECNSGVPDELLRDTLHVQDYKEKNSWHKSNNLKTAFGESNAYNRLETAYKQHEDSLLKQLLNKEGLAQSWSETILPIAHQIVDQVRPNLNHDADDMDIRQYIQIKKVPGGNRNECGIISGLICSKNVAHRGMNAMIAHPKILLLQCGLTYQRVEGKLLSLEPVMLQENEYLGHTVARITALGPDIVLVHRSVSRLAQDRLKDCGVTLVLNVKLSILERVARCTGANIVNSVDAHIAGRYRLGTCQKFYLRNFPNENNGVKTLMFFEGCANSHLGSTILLRGGSQNELKKVKKVTLMMIFSAYSWRMEKSFLMDEFARPPSPKADAFLDENSPKNSVDNADEPEDVLSIERNVDSIQINMFPENYATANDISKNEFSKGDFVFDKDRDLPFEVSRKNDESETQDIDNPLFSPDTFKQGSTVLKQDSDPYDTLKLFKSKSKSVASRDKNNETSSRYGSNSIEQIIRDSEQFATASEQNIATEPIKSNTKPHNASEINLINKEYKTDDVAMEMNYPKSDDEMSEKVKSKDKAACEEKRTYSKSVSDHSDPLHQYLNEENDVFNEANLTVQQLSVADLPLSNKFKKALDDTILSVSPYLTFSIPYLETEPGRNCTLRQFFPKEIYHSMQFTDKVEGVRSNSISAECGYQDNQMMNLRLKPPHAFVGTNITNSADSREVQTLLANFRACGSRIYPTNNVIMDMKPTVVPNDRNDHIAKRLDCLDPLTHQRLSVLFCSFSHSSNTTPAFCVNPWVVNMDLYGRNDIALGLFLERYCLTTEYMCPAQACRAQIAQHARRFTHEGGCVHIGLSKLGNEPFGQENTNRILMWSKCNKCKSVSPVVPMSDDTWSLSFAKYLELRFHGSIYIRRGSDSCQHSLHHDHCQYFSRNNMLAIFKYARVSQWEISLPPPLITINYDPKQHSNVIEEMKNVALKGDEVFSSIRDKLVTLAIDPESLNAMKQQLSKDQQYFKNKIEEIQLKLTSPTLENKKMEGRNAEKIVQSLMFRIEDGIVILKRLISEAVFGWNNRILEITAKKKDDKQRRFAERAMTTGSSNFIESEGFVIDDAAPETQLESPMSADYNAVDAVTAVQTDLQSDFVDNSDNEVVENSNPEDIVVIHESPKTHHRSYSDVLPLASDDIPDKKKKKKTILSQLLPSVPIINPIQCPLGSLEHHLLSLGSVVPIVVYESEPSSIIAYALDSLDYKHKLQELLRSTKGSELNPSPLYKRKFSDNKENASELTQSIESKRPSVLSFLRGSSPNLASPVETEKNLLSTDNLPQTTVATLDCEEDKKALKHQNYIEVQFNDTTTNFFCRIHFASQFAALRENVLLCGEDGFTRSLSRSVQWVAKGGKSGSAFCKTRDDRFILKEMSRLEMQIFLDFAPNYFAYMEKCQQTKQPTLLGKIIGVYRVSFKNNTTNAALRTSLLVMENLFYNRIIKDKFDLKGSVRNRLVNPEETDHEGEIVLLDENLLNMSCDSPLYIRPHAKAVLNKAIEMDTKFLADNSVMDYSLLVGLEPTTDELVLGIIDYIRTFTWDKKLETIVKRSGILGGQGKLPTIVSPEEYRARFIAAMHRYFLPVPDRWTGLGHGVEFS
ncbi:putative 1-phosphatidylinositol 3-phosphate 5-kinase isoform X1 [Neodiprion pinetum]|uniref:putative 1-phosphatidylinositol 3-phosphate 5-kinase isoform X1 n=1 Tax=Neodiprion pinetum TaxID=441929 RepID=UPI001EE134B5|nr:1-phosphatidylinositol 3-phosphate 5-kinase isoform X1 [Neodiprion pinetum]